MRFLKLFSLALLLAAEMLIPRYAQAGKLDSVRDETSGSSSHHEDDDDDDDDDSPGLLGAIVQAFFDGDSDHDDEDVEEPDLTPSPPGPLPFYLEYPYAGGVSGSLKVVPPFSTLEAWQAPCPAGAADCGDANSVHRCAHAECYDDSAFGRSRPPVGLKGARGQFWSEGAGDWDGVYRGTLGAGVQLAGGIGFETRGSLWYEPLVGRNDKLLFWDGNLLFEVPASPETQLYWGLGVRGLFDPTEESETKGGLHGVLRLDVYPARPWVLRIATTVGAINRAFIAEGQVTLGVQLQRFELYGGYSGWLIGETSLHGPALGVRLTI